MQEGLQLYHKLLKKLLEQNQDLHYIKTIIFSRPLVPEIKMNLETKVNQLWKKLKMVLKQTINRKVLISVVKDKLLSQ